MTNKLDFFCYTLNLMLWFFLHCRGGYICKYKCQCSASTASFGSNPKIPLIQDSNKIFLPKNLSRDQKSNLLKNAQSKPAFIIKSGHSSCTLLLRIAKLSWLQISVISTHPVYADTKAEFSSVILLQLAPTLVHQNYWSICRSIGKAA